MLASPSSPSRISPQITLNMEGSQLLLPSTSRFYPSPHSNLSKYESFLLDSGYTSEQVNLLLVKALDTHFARLLNSKFTPSQSDLIVGQFFF